MPHASVSAAPTIDEVDAIAAMDNPVLRNLQITQCYAELSSAMRARTGAAADWCTFATWASRQAGSTIRGEDFLDALDRVLGRRSWILAPLGSISRWLLRKGLFQPDTRLGRAVAEIHTPFDAFERASKEVAIGNLRVFAEIGHQFARFMATVPIVTAEDLGTRVLDVLIPGSRRWPHIAHDPVATVIGWLAGRIRRESVAVTREIVTQALMVLTLPLGSEGLYSALALADDLDATVPPLLRGAHPFLDGFMKSYDPCEPGGTQWGATDWCDLRQRMHYIVHLFRAYAETASLFVPPFTPEQVASFRAGIVPGGEL